MEIHSTRKTDSEDSEKIACRHNLPLVIWIGTQKRIELVYPMFFRSSFGPLCFAFLTLGWASLCFTQTSQPTALNPQRPATTSDGKLLPEPQSNGTITGTVVDQSGAVVTGA